MMKKVEHEKPERLTKPQQLGKLEPGNEKRSFHFDAETVKILQESDLKPFELTPEIRAELDLEKLQALSQAAPDGSIHGHVHYNAVIEEMRWGETALPVMDSNLSGPVSGIVAAARVREGYERPDFFNSEADFPRSTHCYYNAGLVAGLMWKEGFKNVRVQACTLTMPNQPSHYVPVYDKGGESAYAEIYPMLGTGPNNATDSIRVARSLPDDYQKRHIINGSELNNEAPTINRPVDDHTASGMVEGFKRGIRLSTGQ